MEAGDSDGKANWALQGTFQNLHVKAVSRHTMSYWHSASVSNVVLSLTAHLPNEDCLTVWAVNIFCGIKISLLAFAFPAWLDQ